MVKTKNKKRPAKKQPAKIIGLSLLVQRSKRIIKIPEFPRFYVLASVGILLATTLFWSLLSANLQTSNADQLVNNFLFQHSSTFHDSVFPGAHSFLLKWPVFWLVNLFGLSAATFTIFTALATLATVGLFAYLLYRIERRPLVFGTICLALASVLLLVPAQPYAGALLPVNMAMIATRNVEYLVFIGSLLFFAKATRLKSWYFVSAASLLGLLIASDKLFGAISLGGAVLALGAYLLARQRQLVRLSSRWLTVSLIGLVAGSSILWWINLTKITHITNQTSSGPYHLVHSLHDLALGVLYAVLGLLTNFGANPAYDSTVVRHIPTQIHERLTSLGGPAYIINSLILVAGLYATICLLKNSLRNKELKLDTTHKISLLMIWSGISAVVIFMLSNHYYAVDARYLTLTLFALFFALAVWARSRKIDQQRLSLVGLVLSLSIIFGTFGAFSAYHSQKYALKTFDERNQLVAQILAQHPVTTLVGDYWRVMPIDLAAKNHFTPMPLNNCTQSRPTLTSTKWQKNLDHTSFAYLISFDLHLTDYPSCQLTQVIQAYGKPNSSIAIAGTLKSPKEMLLFYDHGTRKGIPTLTPVNPVTSGILPIKLEELKNLHCYKPTTMNIVAHQDDDLLFMNPDILHDVRSGNCVRTIYVTAGDAGAGKFYWLSREHGSEIAYSTMLRIDNIWLERNVELAKGQFITVASSRAVPGVSLIFVHLPDGNIRGNGFRGNERESLSKLDSGILKQLHTVDAQSVYSSEELTAGLLELMQAYRPDEIRTQSNYKSRTFPDHSDHMTVGRFVQRAYAHYENKVPIKFYKGYTNHELPSNVSGEDFTIKQMAFLAYAQYDNSVCHTAADCSKNPAYGAYLSRQYQSTY